MTTALAALSPGRLAAPDTTRRSRSVLSHCPGSPCSVRNDDPHRIQHGGPFPDDDHTSHHRLTLDDLITGVWEGLSSHHTVTCPVCGGKMAPRYGSGARPVGGRCQRCGSTLG
jgi:DnaJ-class molecular chaperone